MSTSVPTLTLDELRNRFWWMGPSRKESHILSIEDQTVTVKVVQGTWVRRTTLYEEAISRDFAILGLKVVWKVQLRDDLQAEIEEAREACRKAKTTFDENSFLEAKQWKELRRNQRR